LQLPSADEDIIKALDTAPPLDPAVATAAWGDRFDASELVLINGALAGYAEYFGGGSLGDLVWAPNLFIVGDSHQRLNSPIDITPAGNPTAPAEDQCPICFSLTISGTFILSARLSVVLALAPETTGLDAGG
jgi:hypothetical protein